MTGEFLTEGLQNDRYLKAIRLIEQFEIEMEARLRKLGRRMVDKHPSLFGSPLETSTSSSRDSGKTLAYQRIDYKMRGVQVSDDESTPRLNVHFYWVDPAKYARTDIDGALRAFGYKIKFANTNVDEQVADQTRASDWPIEITDDPFGSRKIFYKHVNSIGDIEETANSLVDHFSEFGNAYTENSSMR